MVETSRIRDHLSAEQIRMKMQMTAGFMKMQKWLVIYNAIIDPRPVSEIAKHTGLSEGSVYRIISEYNRSGPESLDSMGANGSMWFDLKVEPTSM